MWGPIIGAGISALGSLFGGDDDEETTTTVDYRKMAREAERAGFNPLTAIRNGGSAGFTTTHHPGLSASDRFGQAFQTIGAAIMSFDARADERAELEQQLLRAQIGQINRQGGASQRLWSFDVPQAAGSTISTKAAAGGAGAGAPTPTFTDPKDRTATNPFDTDSGILIDRNSPDASVMATRYGEPGEWIGGAHNADKDWQRNRPRAPINDENVEAFRKRVQRLLTHSTPGNAIRHWNLPANRGW